MYYERVELWLDKLSKLIPASVSLMLPELTNMCKDFLLYKVEHDTSACIDIHRTAKENSLTEIADRAWKMMLGNFLGILKGNAFKEMSQTDLQDYISDERLNVANENPVFEAVVTWVRHDVENRKSSFEKLMENVKLPHCSQQFLSEVVRMEPLMETLKCFGHLSDPVHSPLTSARPCCKARSGYYTLVAVYEDSLYLLKGWESEWVSKALPNEKILKYSSIAMIGDDILISGGHLYGTYFSRKCWKLTLPTMKWVALPDFNVVRHDHTTVCVGNQVYVLGGHTSKAMLSWEYLDEQHESWQHRSRGGGYLSLVDLTAVSHKHLIYVFGGTLPQIPLILDTVSKEWKPLLEWDFKNLMPGACMRGSSVVYRDRIYVLGGEENCCMSYDTDQDKWTTHSKPATNHVRASAVVWKDRILLCGGEDTSVIEEYNPDTDTWSEWNHQLPKASSIPPAVFAIHM